MGPRPHVWQCMDGEEEEERAAAADWRLGGLAVGLACAQDASVAMQWAGRGLPYPLLPAWRDDMGTYYFSA